MIREVEKQRDVPGLARLLQVGKRIYAQQVDDTQRKGETDKQIADFTKVIEKLPGAPVDPLANALINRGVTWEKKGDGDGGRRGQVSPYTFQ